MQEAFGLDSNCLVAILTGWHQHHAITRSALARLRSSGEANIYIATHSLLECFANLTAFPKPLKVSPKTAVQLIEDAFGDLDKKESNLRDAEASMKVCRENGYASGMVYDALIAHALHRQGATHLLTWNVRHMERVAPAGLRVLRPDQVLL